MAIDVKAGRGAPERPHKTTPGAVALAKTEILQNKWVQGALVAVCLFLIYFATSAESNLYNQYVRLADSFLHGRLYLEDPPEYLELARYYDSGVACKGPEEGCKGYVIDPSAPAVLLLPFVAVFGADLNQVLVSMVFGAAAMGLFWVATRQLGWNLHAPRGALSYPQRSWEELEGRFLGLMAYLDAKARGNSSLVRHEAP